MAHLLLPASISVLQLHQTRDGKASGGVLNFCIALEDIRKSYDDSCWRGRDVFKVYKGERDRQEYLRGKLCLC